MSDVPSREEIARIRDLALSAHFRQQDQKNPLFLGERRDPTPEELEALALWRSEFEWFEAASEIGVPERHWPARLNGPDVLETPALRAVRTFLDAARTTEARCLGLFGPPGTGKTWGCSAGIRWIWAWRRWRPCYLADYAFFIAMPELTRRLLDPELRGETFERARDAVVFALDDIGSGARLPEFVAGMVEELITAREARPHGVTFLSANLKPAQLAGLLGDRVADRLAGPWAALYQVPGTSLRRRRPAYV
jgi:hypothetical protein